MTTKKTSAAKSAATGEKTGTENNGAVEATTVTPAGAPDQVVDDVDMSHPAVDSDPRAETTAEQNRIDFNDPTLSGAEAAEKNLKDQAKA